MNTYSADFVGSSEQYTAVNSTDFYITGSMTLECWVKTSNTGDAMIFMAVDKAQANQRAYRFWLIQGNIRFDQYSGNDSEADYPIQAISKDGNWHHYAIVFDASIPAIYGYVDGVLVATFSPSGSSGTSSPTGSPPFMIAGHGSNGNFDNLTGLIDEVRVWSTVRSASDISNNYMRELAGNEANLVAYYKFNNNWNDSGPNELNLSVGGLPTFSTDVPFTDNTTTSTTTTTSSTSTTTTSTSSSTTTTSTSSTTSTTTTLTSTSTTTTSTSTTTTSTSTTSSTSTSSTTTLTVTPQSYFFTVERIK